MTDLQLDPSDRHLAEGAWWDGRYWRTKRGRIHRLVMEKNYGVVGRGWVVDHINRNPSDNRLENLRIVTQSTNVRNSDGKSSVRKSKYRGVFRARKRWTAQITVNKVRRHLGMFASEWEAAEAYRRAEMIYCGLAGKP